MRKFIVLTDGYRQELSPLTNDEFCRALPWIGADDTAFDHFLRHNHYTEIHWLREEVLVDAVVELLPGEPTFDTGIVYGDPDVCLHCQTCG